MAIADRLNKLRTDIEDTYQAINNLGGTIPSDKNTNNIPEAIRSVYDNLPKVSDTGTSVSLSPTLKGRLGIVPKGNTYQESTTGKNFLPINQIQTQTINGITITNLSDGTIKINGTTTTTTRIDIAYTKELIANTEYKFTNANTRGTGANVNVQDSSNNVIGSIVLNVSSQTFTPTTTQTITKMRLYIDSGQTFSNYILKTMLIKSSDDATRFEPYTGGQPSPSPDYPQEIQSATGTQSITISGGTGTTPVTKTVNLGNIKLNKIDTYEDYIGGTPDNWVLYKNIGKVVLGKTLSSVGTTNFSNVYQIYANVLNISYLMGGYCDNFKFNNDKRITDNNSANSWLSNNQCALRLGNETARDRFYVKSSNFATANELKEYFNNNPTTLCYVLATPTETPITEEPLVSQLNELYYLQSYNDTTNIDVTGNLPMRITASAIKGA